MLSICVDKVMFLFQLCIACWCHDHPDLHSMETRIFGYCPQLRDAHLNMEIEDGVYRALSLAPRDFIKQTEANIEVLKQIKNL